MLVEAVAAIDGAVATWLKRNRSILAAFGADYWVHLARAPIKPAESIAGALVSARLTARRAPLGVIFVTLLGMVRLVVSAERETFVALDTR